VLNARLSVKSSRRYYRYRYFFRSLFKSLDFVLVQTSQDAARFEKVGVPSSRVHVLGNMKFDNLSLPDTMGFQNHSLKKEWCFKEEDYVFVAGSTHSGEEEMLERLFSQIEETMPSFRMLIAPRHIERSEKIATFFRSKGFKVRLATDACSRDSEFQVLILNQLGILKRLYAIADIVFVGGSMVPHGGQNPIEPAHFKRAILHGPNVLNFEDVYRNLDQQGGAILVRDESQLAFALKRLIHNRSECQVLGNNAYRVVHGLRGATDRHVTWLEAFLKIKPQSNPRIAGMRKNSGEKVSTR